MRSQIILSDFRMLDLISEMVIYYISISQPNPMPEISSNSEGISETRKSKKTHDEWFNEHANLSECMKIGTISTEAWLA